MGIKIGIDFDGTCVTHAYPLIGKDIGAVPVLQRLVSAGHQLILNTMRSGPELAAAVEWFKANNLPLYGVNKDPDQHTWTASPKVHAGLYIDDAALGCPLIHTPTDAFVNWPEVERQLEAMGFFRPPITLVVNNTIGGPK